MLCGVIAVLQASGLKCGSLEPFPFQQDGQATTEVDVGGRQGVQALVVTVTVVVADEVADLKFKLTSQKVVFKQERSTTKAESANTAWPNSHSIINCSRLSIKE